MTADSKESLLNSVKVKRRKMKLSRLHTRSISLEDLENQEPPTTRASNDACAFSVTSVNNLAVNSALTVLTDKNGKIQRSTSPGSVSAKGSEGRKRLRDTFKPNRIQSRLSISYSSLCRNSSDEVLGRKGSHGLKILKSAKKKLEPKFRKVMHRHSSLNVNTLSVRNSQNKTPPLSPSCENLIDLSAQSSKASLKVIPIDFHDLSELSSLNVSDEENQRLLGSSSKSSKTNKQEQSIKPKSQEGRKPEVSTQETYPKASPQEKPGNDNDSSAYDTDTTSCCSSDDEDFETSRVERERWIDDLYNEINKEERRVEHVTAQSRWLRVLKRNFGCFGGSSSFYNLAFFVAIFLGLICVGLVLIKKAETRQQYYLAATSGLKDEKNVSDALALYISGMTLVVLSTIGIILGAVYYSYIEIFEKSE